MSSLTAEYRAICGYRQGARYCKMDLHTHSPASECSSFTLPAVMEAAFPQREDGESKGDFHERRYEFVKEVAKGTNPFEGAYDSEQVKEFPRLGKRPPLDNKAVRQIAQQWVGDVLRFYPDDAVKPPKEQKDQRDQCVDRAIEDLQRYLKSLFFPEEYVTRCHIEGLQLVALTDHNHPGYIVKRLPALGTWFSRLQAVNAEYVKRIHAGDSGDKVRGTIVDRLQRARERLSGHFDEASHVTAGIKGDHKDPGKKPKDAKERLERVDELIGYWQDETHPLGPLTLLPGVEITASNVHLLAVFPPEWFVAGRIGSILREIGIPESQWGRGFEAAASASVQDTITEVDNEGGIVIPAHANSDFKGILRLFRKGLALNKVIEHPALLALETIGGTVIAGEGKKKPGKDPCETLRWLEQGRYRPGRAKPLCFVKGSDAHEARIELDGTGEDLGARFTYVKMDIRDNDTPEEVFRSLRLALLSGQSRVIESPTEDGYNYTAPKNAYRIKKKDRQKLLECETLRPTVLGLTVQGEGCYADGLSLRFNPFLNCVLGSGGKSTLVRLVGYAFGQQGFMPGTKASWLPERVRAFWRQDGHVYAVERKGQHPDPDDAEVQHYQLADGQWTEIAAGDAPNPQIVLWPSRDVQDKKDKLSRFEEDVIEDLVEHLGFQGFAKAGPLLVNQPVDIFNSQKLFQAVLSKPYLKYRQIIWSTGSANVPTALDAEKIIVTTEVKRGKQMKMVCAGDLHEDEIREALLCELEGGPFAFGRRSTLYSM